MTARVCFTMDNLGDAADLGRGVIRAPRQPGQRPALEVGFPAMLDLYGRQGVSITHFVEGWNGEAHPDELRELIRRGHTLGIHGWMHEKWSELSDKQAHANATRATEALEQATGVRPRAFRAPGGARTLSTASILANLGYRIDASLDPSGREGGDIRRLAGHLWTVPYCWVGVDAAHWLWHDTPCKDTEEIWKNALLEAARGDGHFVFIWHPHVMGVDAARRAAGANILAFVRENPLFEIVTLEQLIRR